MDTFFLKKQSLEMEYIGWCSVRNNTREQIVAKKLWKNDKIQFARLLSEIEDVCDCLNSDDWICLSDSMDLSEDEVGEIFDRAQKFWNKCKKQYKGVS